MDIFIEEHQKLLIALLKHKVPKRRLLVSDHMVAVPEIFEEIK